MATMSPDKAHKTVTLDYLISNKQHVYYKLLQVVNNVYVHSTNQ